MGREIYDIINDMAEVLNASQMQKLQEVLAKCQEIKVFKRFYINNLGYIHTNVTSIIDIEP